MSQAKTPQKPKQITKPIIKDEFTTKMNSLNYFLVPDTGFFEKKINDSSAYSINKETVNGTCIVTFTVLHNTQFGLLNCSFTTGVVEKDIDSSLIDNLEKFVMVGMEAMLKNVSLSKEEEEKEKI